MKILVTGSAGFIGAHVAAKLISLGHDVVGIDSLTDYYDVNLKLNRLEALCGIVKEKVNGSSFVASDRFPNFKFRKMTTADRDLMQQLFEAEAFDLVCHLASQSGVRYSVENPYAYIDNNINGFITILEGCRNHKIQKLVYASSSSVYGDTAGIPFKESDRVDTPVSFYAATKKANELMAYSYSHLYGISSVGLRFFTVYGPWGRPDMAPFLFSKSIIEGSTVKLFNGGDLYRDFTYIDDIVEGVVRTLTYSLPDTPDGIPYYVYNIGNHTPVRITEFIETIEDACGLKATTENLPMQPGDVHITYADVTELKNAVGFAPDTPLATGIRRFIKWYRSYYNLLKKSDEWQMLQKMQKLDGS